MFSKLLAAFIPVPILELYLFITIGKAIGPVVTVLIVLATAVLGAYLAKREGLSVMARMQSSSAQGRIPHQEVIDGVLILFAGALLLTPGFLTDAFGFSLLFPPSRLVYRTYLTHVLKGRVNVQMAGSGFPRRGARPERIARDPEPPQQSKNGEVIDVEVL